jgi:hypothetical protein
MDNFLPHEYVIRLTEFTMKKSFEVLDLTEDNILNRYKQSERYI